jgi:choline kinase
VKNLQLLIPAAGIGKRFVDAGIITPKPLIEIGSIPMICWVIANFGLQEGDKVIIVSQKDYNLKKLLQPFIREVKCEVVFINISNQTEGPAATCLMAGDALNYEAPLIIANSDQYIHNGIKEFTQLVRAGFSNGYILTMFAEGTQWSYVSRDIKTGKINRVREKVQISNEATVGVYGWSKAKSFIDSAVEMIAKKDMTNNEFYVAPSYNYRPVQGKIEGLNLGQVGNFVHGLGTPKDLSKFTQHKNFHKYLEEVRLELRLGA